MSLFIIFCAFFCGFNFSWRRFLRLFHKAMQKDQGISLPYNVKNAGDIAGKFDSKLPNILFDVFYMRLFQRRTALRQKFDLSKRF